jgi:hypothetical protein
MAARVIFNGRLETSWAFANDPEHRRDRHVTITFDPSKVSGLFEKAQVPYYKGRNNLAGAAVVVLVTGATMPAPYVLIYEDGNNRVYFDPAKALDLAMYGPYSGAWGKGKAVVGKAFTITAQK